MRNKSMFFQNIFVFKVKNLSDHPRTFAIYSNCMYNIYVRTLHL